MIDKTLSIYLRLFSSIFVILALVLNQTVSGFVIATATKWYGDTTAEEHGFLTLAPAAHIDWVVCLLSFFVAAVLAFVGASAESSILFLLYIVPMSGLYLRIYPPINFRRLNDPDRDLAVVGMWATCAPFLLACFLLFLFKLLVLFGSSFISMSLFAAIAQFISLLSRLSIFYFVVTLLLPHADREDYFYWVLRYFWPNAARFLESLDPVWLMIFYWVVLFSRVLDPIQDFIFKALCVFFS